MGRVRSRAKAAEACGRSVCVVGRSLHRMIGCAIECGMLKDVPDFISEEDAATLPASNVLYIVTGSQGEYRAALAKIARGDFRTVKLTRGDAVIFSELSPRPHDTGMVTLVSQNLTEFDLHARAVMGLPVPDTIRARPAASAVILADRESESVSYDGLAEAMANGSDVRIFAKPVTRLFRRMGVALATAGDTDEARRLAKEAADRVTLTYD